MNSKNGKRLAATPARSFAHLQGAAPKGKVAEAEEDKKDKAEGEDKENKDDKEAEDEKPPANDKEKGSKSKKAKKAKCDDEDMAEAEEDDAEDEEDDEDEDKEKKEKAELALSSGPVAEARERERARCASIFGHESAAGRTELAANLAFNTTMTANEATRILGSVPAAPVAKAGRLGAAMSGVKQPAVGPDGPQAPAKPTSTAMAEGITRTLDKVRGQQSN